MGELYLGYIVGAITFGWLLPWIDKKLNIRNGGTNNG